MAKGLNLTELNDKHPYVKRLVKDLEKAVGQKVAITTVAKVKRTSGVSTTPITFVFDGGQSLEIFVRSQGDVIKATLNGKVFAIVGDLNNSFDDHYKIAIETISEKITSGQKTFEANLTKEKITPPKSTNSSPKSSVSKQLQVLGKQEKQLDEEIKKRQAVHDDLRQKLKVATVQAVVR